MSVEIGYPVSTMFQRLEEGLYPQSSPSYDQFLHLCSTVGYGQCPRIPEISLHRVLLGKPHSAMNLDGL